MCHSSDVTLLRFQFKPGQSIFDQLVFAAKKAFISGEFQGTRYVEVEAKFSTLTCSVCRAQSGPRGLSGLAESTRRPCGAVV
jgi:hypothetical protein